MDQPHTHPSSLSRASLRCDCPSEATGFRIAIVSTPSARVLSAGPDYPFLLDTTSSPSMVEVYDHYSSGASHISSPELARMLPDGQYWPNRAGYPEWGYK